MNSQPFDEGGFIDSQIPCGGNGFGSGCRPKNWRYRKLDMSIFDGSDPVGWILRVKWYFTFY